VENTDKFSDFQKNKEDKYKYDSKERLSKTLKKKIETTMIGALSSVEEHFSFLWSDYSGETISLKEMTPDQKAMYDIYQRIRSEILDKGNAQSRNIDTELNQYEVKWLKYSITIPVKHK
jgi:hypothetical protein